MSHVAAPLNDYKNYDYALKNKMSIRNIKHFLIIKIDKCIFTDLRPLPKCLIQHAKNLTFEEK